MSFALASESLQETTPECLGFRGGERGTAGDSPRSSGLRQVNWCVVRFARTRASHTAVPRHARRRTWDGERALWWDLIERSRNLPAAMMRSGLLKAGMCIAGGMAPASARSISIHSWKNATASFRWLSQLDRRACDTVRCACHRCGTCHIPHIVVSRRCSSQTKATARTVYGILDECRAHRLTSF